MAERRMFAKSVIDSDLFLDMPPTTQMLYFHLAMRADDDGFINNPKRIQRMIGASDDDMRILVAKRFILIFESGVIVIRHWKLHNYIRKDMYHPTEYQEEFQRLSQKSSKSPYEVSVDAVSDNTLQTCNETVTDMSQDCNENVSLGKDRVRDRDRVRVSSSNKYTDSKLTSNTGTTSLYDDDLREVIELFENNIGEISPYIVANLQKLKDEYTKEWVVKAIQRAVAGGRDKSNIRYVVGVLKGWKNDGSAKPWEGAENGRRFSSNAKQHTENSAREGEKWANETDGWD